MRVIACLLSDNPAKLAGSHAIPTRKPLLTTTLPYKSGTQTLPEHPTLGLVAGHIDILQITPDGIMLLDYKPNARKETPAKVVTQLSLYAEALHRRAAVPVSAIRCAYFDECDIYYFAPVDVQQTVKAQHSAYQTYPARRA